MQNQKLRFPEADEFLKSFEFHDHWHSENFCSRELILLKVLKVLVKYFSSSEYSKQFSLERLNEPGLVYVHNSEKSFESEIDYWARRNENQPNGDNNLDYLFVSRTQTEGEYKIRLGNSISKEETDYSAAETNDQSTEIII
jgi:hypothetical protein